MDPSTQPPVEVRSGFPAGAITLDSDNDAYWAGSHITGSLQFTLIMPTTFQAINVMFEGEARVQWTDNETEAVGNMEETRSVQYTSRENYFQFVMTVAGGSAGPVNLPPGMHSYKLHYQMPSKIPSSFESEIGHIRYRVIGFTEYGRDGAPNLDLSVIKLFTVICPYDLNENPCSREPLHFDFEETASGCFSCDSRPLSVQLSLPNTGYCPGQTIPIDVKADNRSGIEVQKILVSMRKKVEYHSNEPQSDMGIDDEVLVTMKKGPIPSNTRRNFDINLEVPAELAMNFDNCSLIDVSYYLKVELKLSGCNEDCEDDADLIIGTIPLTGVQDDHYRHPLADQMPHQPLPAHQAPTLAYPTNTPYPTPAQPYPDAYPSPQKTGYPVANSYPTNIGFNMGNLGTNSDPPPYPGYPTGGSPGFPGGNPAPHRPHSPYPAAPYPPASNNSPVGFSPSAPSAPPGL